MVDFQKAGEYQHIEIASTANVEIGQDVTIRSFVSVEVGHGATLKLGNRVFSMIIVQFVVGNT